MSPDGYQTATVVSVCCAEDPKPHVQKRIDATASKTDRAKGNLVNNLHGEHGKKEKWCTQHKVPPPHICVKPNMMCMLAEHAKHIYG